jgi:hypothetical protein
VWEVSRYMTMVLKEALFNVKWEAITHHWAPIKGSKPAQRRGDNARQAMRRIAKLHGGHHPLPVQALQQEWQPRLSCNIDVTLLTVSGPGKSNHHNCIKVRESPGCVDTKFLQNVKNHWTNDTVSRARRAESYYLSTSKLTL